MIRLEETERLDRGAMASAAAGALVAAAGTFLTPGPQAWRCPDASANRSRTAAGSPSAQPSLAATPSPRASSTSPTWPTKLAEA